MYQWSVINVKVTGFVLYLNSTKPLPYTLANEYPTREEINQKTGPVRGYCIAYDALFIMYLLTTPLLDPHNEIPYIRTSLYLC